MVRVLHVIGAMDRAGAETLLMNLYRSIDRSKVQFDFLVNADGPSDYDEEIMSLAVASSACPVITSSTRKAIRTPFAPS